MPPAALSANELSHRPLTRSINCSLKNRSPPLDLRLAAQLATLQGGSAAAIDYAQRALRSPDAPPLEVLRSALLVFLNTTSTTAAYSEALHQFVKLARHDTAPAGLQALRMMAAPAHKARMTNPVSAEPPIVFPSSGPDFMSPAEIADKIENHPMAGVYDRLCAASLRTKNNPISAERRLDEAIDELPPRRQSHAGRTRRLALRPRPLRNDAANTAVRSRRRGSPTFPGAH